MEKTSRMIIFFLILSFLSELDLWNAVIALQTFRDVVAKSPKLKKKLSLILDANFIARAQIIRPLYVDLNLKKITIKNWREDDKKLDILEYLDLFRDSVEEIDIVDSIFENDIDLNRVLRGLTNLKALNFKGCKIKSMNFNEQNYQLSNNSVFFEDCNENVLNFLTNQASIKNITIRSEKEPWSGFPRQVFHNLVLTLDNVDFLKFEGAGTSNYFDYDSYPYRIRKLNAESLTMNYYGEISEPRLDYLSSQLNVLKDLKIHELPHDFDGAIIIKYIIESMKLENFIYGKIELICNGEKQCVKQFSANEGQILAAFEIIKQFKVETFIWILTHNAYAEKDQVKRSLNTLKDTPDFPKYFLDKITNKMFEEFFDFVNNLSKLSSLDREPVRKKEIKMHLPDFGYTPKRKELQNPIENYQTKRSKMENDNTDDEDDEENESFSSRSCAKSKSKPCMLNYDDSNKPKELENSIENYQTIRSKMESDNIDDKDNESFSSRMFAKSKSKPCMLNQNDLLKPIEKPSYLCNMKSFNTSCLEDFILIQPIIKMLGKDITRLKLTHVSVSTLKVLEE